MIYILRAVDVNLGPVAEPEPGRARPLQDHLKLEHVTVEGRHRRRVGRPHAKPAERAHHHTGLRPGQSFLFHSWWVRPLGEVTDSTVNRSSRPLDPSQRDTPRPRVIGTITRCMKSTRSAWRN